MPRPFIPLSTQQFAELLSKFTFTRQITAVHVHGTWRPNHSQDKGLASVESMFTFHTKTNGWSDIAQHLTIDSRGVIWTGRSWNQTPASASGHNTGAFMFEMIGDFDRGKDKFTDPQMLTAHVVTALVLRKCGLRLNNIRFHNEFTDLKTCPGTSIDLTTFRQAVNKQLVNFSDNDPIAFDEEQGSSFGASDDEAGLESARKVRSLLLDFIGTTPATVSDAEADAELDCGPEQHYDGNGMEADSTTIPDPALDLPADMFRSGKTAEDTTIVMPRKVVGPINVNAQFTEVDGMALFEGDIVLSEADEAREANKEGSRGVGIIGTKFRWPDSIIPYVIKDAALTATVQAAISHWEKNTPFRFVKRIAGQSDYISFEARSGCWSRVGRQGGMQVISLGGGCGIGSAIHEIGHAMGLWHEQSRSDRDQHITIVWDNIDPQFRHNFDKHVLDGQDLGAYDFGSIMHYPAKAFALDTSKPTILTANGQPIGQRTGLSKGDIGALKLLYPKLKWAQVGQAVADGQAIADETVPAE